MNKPALLVVDDDAQVLAAVRRDLRARYRESYTIISASSGEEALATIRELKARGDSLAIVISDQRMPGMQGTDVLAQSRDIYPLARRVLLTAYSDIDAAIKAINVAHLDHYLSKPWDPPEERLFPVIDDLLDAWQAEYLPEAKGLRLVGHQWSPRSHAIKDFLAGNLIPYRWLDVARNPDAQSLLDAAGIGAERASRAVLRGWVGAAQPRAASGGRAPRQIAVGRAQSVRPRDCRRRSLRPRGGGVRRVGRFADAVARSARARRAGGQQLPNRELSRVSSRRQRQRTDAARRDAGAAAWRGAARAARSDRRVHRRGIQAPDARRWPEIVTRTLLAATGMEYREHPAPGVAAHTGAGVYYGAATTEAPAFSDRRVARCRRWELGGTGGHAPGALREGRADRGATRIPARHHVAVPHRAD